MVVWVYVCVQMSLARCLTVYVCICMALSIFAIYSMRLPLFACDYVCASGCVLFGSVYVCAYKLICLLSFNICIYIMSNTT